MLRLGMLAFMAKPDPVFWLTKIMHRLADDNEAEALNAFRRLRSHCRNHKIILSEFRMTRGDSGGGGDTLLEQYLAALDLFKQTDPRLTELERINRKLQREIEQLKKRSPPVKRRRVIKPKQELTGDA